MNAATQTHLVPSREIVARSGCAVLERRDAGAEGDAELISRIDRVPQDARILGLFMAQVSRLVGDGHAGRYSPLGMYPVRDYMRLLVRAARSSCAVTSLADNLFQLGFGVYPQYTRSLAGGAIFSLARGQFGRAVELSSRAYGLTLDPGNIQVVACDGQSATLELREVWPFPELFHTGIWLGAMETFGERGTIRVVRHSDCDVDFHLAWGAAAARFSEEPLLLGA